MFTVQHGSGIDQPSLLSGASVNAKDQGWLTPLHRAAASRNEVRAFFFSPGYSSIRVVLSRTFLNWLPFLEGTGVAAKAGGGGQRPRPTLADATARGCC